MKTKTKTEKTKNDTAHISSLTKFERETIINFNEAEAIAWVFTYSKKWQSHFENKLGIKPVSENSFGGKEYTIDKSRIRPPRVATNKTKEQIEKISTILANARQKRSKMIKNTVPEQGKSKVKIKSIQ